MLRKQRSLVRVTMTLALLLLAVPAAGFYASGTQPVVADATAAESATIPPTGPSTCDDCGPETMTAQHPTTAMLMGFGLVGLVWSGGRRSPMR